MGKGMLRAADGMSKLAFGGREGDLLCQDRCVMRRRR